MKRWLTIVCLLCCVVTKAQKKDLSLERLIQLTTLPKAELASRLDRYDFRLHSTTDSAATFHKAPRKTGLQKIVTATQYSDKREIVFRTKWAEEFKELTAELDKQTFLPAKTKTIAPGLYSWYQKGGLCIQPSITGDSTETWYNLYIEQKLLPQAADIRYAEDLLQLTSHEYLAAVFGTGQVRKDQFYFSETELSKCSVLFPGTARQTIIVWQDEANNRYPDLLIVGNMGTSTQMVNYSATKGRGWPSATGVYTGMPLKALEELNGAPLQFYGWDTEEPGVVLPEQKGTLNFKRLGVQLQCLDCNEDVFYSTTGILNSEILLRQARRVFVSTIVIKP